jgi:hypothetical protein
MRRLLFENASLERQPAIRKDICSRRFTQSPPEKPFHCADSAAHVSRDHTSEEGHILGVEAASANDETADAVRMVLGDADADPRAHGKPKNISSWNRQLVQDSNNISGALRL